MRRGLAILVLAATASSCSYFSRKDAPSPPPVIRYMNLKAVYEFLLNRTRDALEVKKKSDAIADRMREIERERRERQEEKREHAALDDEYDRLRGDYDSLKKAMKGHKVKLLSRIDRAVRNVAKKKKIDFVHNIGDELLYARKEYDISDEIVRELVRIEDRSAPESR